MTRKVVEKITAPSGIDLSEVSVVEKVYFREGEVVAKNDLIAKIVSGNYCMDIFCRKSGILRVYVEEGQVVKENDLLFEICAANPN
jgi:multidrug efflux pump subunit AcrA (membrane-fusion protein)